MPTLEELTEKLDQQAAAHTEKTFIIKSLLMVFCLLSLRTFFGGLFWLFLSFALFNYIAYLWVNTDRGIWGILRDQISFIPTPRVPVRDKLRNTAWATWGLIFVNIFVYFCIQTEENTKFIRDNLEFIPAEPNLFNVPLSLLSYMYLHGSFMHLFGNMSFLWAIGTIVERRIGWRRFLGYYHAAGVAGALLSFIVYVGGLAENLKLIGASAAITGIMGVFIVRCYFKEMLLPLPAFGFLPINFNMRLNGLVVIGLYTSLDLRGGLQQLLDPDASRTGYWTHLGGVAMGVWLAWRAKLGEGAVEERHRDIGSGVLDGKTVLNDQFLAAGGFEGARRSLLIALDKVPHNAETLLSLARIESHTVLKPEGQAYYQQAIEILFNKVPEEAAEAFREYFPRYRVMIKPEVQYRLASLLQKQGYLDLAEQALMQLVDCPDVPREIRESALFYSARIMEQMELPDPAVRHYSRFLSEHPHSERIESVRARLALLPLSEDVGSACSWAGGHSR